MGLTLNTIIGFAYDYFIKDHLGNVRMLLTDELKQDVYPAATQEGTLNAIPTNSRVNYENGFYTIDATKVIAETSIPFWGYGISG